jgi:hypothetical protein
MEKRMPVFWGAGGGGLHPSAAKAVKGGLDSRGFFVRGGGKAQDQSSKNQPLTFFFGTLLAARVGMVRSKTILKHYHFSEALSIFTSFYVLSLT